MAISTYLARALARAVVHGVNYTAPVTVYVSLHSADPGTSGASELASTGNYARASFTSATGTTDPTLTIPSLADNTGEILFPTATSSWNGGTPLAYIGIWDALGGGNFLIGGVISPPVTVAAGDTPRLAIGDLDISFGA